MKACAPRALVLCEGNDDMLVMKALAQHLGLKKDSLEFQQYGGETRARDYLNNLKAGPEYVRGELAKILVTRDADNDYNSAWQSLQNAIQGSFWYRLAVRASGSLRKMASLLQHGLSRALYVQE